MASNIDDTKPTEGNATTASVRTNFGHAKAEIEAIQNQLAAERKAAISAKSSNVFNVPANTHTKCTLGTVELDQNGWFSNSRFTPQLAGWYQVNGMAILQASLAVMQVSIYKNGASTGFPAQVNTASGLNIGQLIYMNGTTDYIELYVFSSVQQDAEAKLSAHWVTNG